LVDRRFTVAEAAPCYLIRLSSDACPYCRLDNVQYTWLVQQGQEAGCKTIIMSPKVGQIKSNGDSGGMTQLQFVDMKFGRELNPYITPQTFLLDSGGRMLWNRVGAMDKQAVSSSLRALGGVR
jgi:hypothetical protein